MSIERTYPIIISSPDTSLYLQPSYVSQDQWRTKRFIWFVCVCECVCVSVVHKNVFILHRKLYSDRKFLHFIKLHPTPFTFAPELCTDATKFIFPRSVELHWIAPLYPVLRLLVVFTLILFLLSGSDSFLLTFLSFFHI